MENALKNIDSIVKDRKLSVGAKALFFLYFKPWKHRISRQK